MDNANVFWGDRSSVNFLFSVTPRNAARWAGDVSRWTLLNMMSPAEPIYVARCLFLWGSSI